MTLKLTKQQKKYFDESGIISAEGIKRAFKRSVEDQEKMRKEAAKIRARRRPSK